MNTARELLEAIEAAPSIDREKAADLVLQVQDMIKADPAARPIYESVIFCIYRKAGLIWRFDYRVKDIRLVPPSFLMVQHGPVWSALLAWSFGVGEEIPGIHFFQTWEDARAR